VLTIQCTCDVVKSTFLTRLVLNTFSLYGVINGKLDIFQHVDEDARADHALEPEPPLPTDRCPPKKIDSHFRHVQERTVNGLCGVEGGGPIKAKRGDQPHHAGRPKSK